MAIIKKLVRLKMKRNGDTIVSYPQTVEENVLVDNEEKSLKTKLSEKAPLDSPALTGVPTAPTAAAGTDSDQIATTAFVTAQGFLTSSPVTSVADKTGDVILDKSDVGLSNADDTSDIDKPISTAVQDALDTKQNIDGDASNLTAAFEEAQLREALSSGEKLSVIFGKIAKWLNALEAVAFSGSYSDLSDTPSQADSESPGLLSPEDKTKLDQLDPVTYANVIESISQNGEPLEITDKSVNISVPQKTSELDNDAGFITEIQQADGVSPGLLSPEDKIKLDQLDPVANANVIESISQNGEPLEITDKSVNISVPQKTSELDNDSGFINELYQADGEISGIVTLGTSGGAARYGYKEDVGLDSVDNTSDSDKNVASAAKLTIARSINGVSFDGTEDITITAAPNSHTHSEYLSAAGGTLTGQLTAGGSQTIGTAQIRNVVMSTADLTAGSSSLATGQIYIVYEG